MKDLVPTKLHAQALHQGAQPDIAANLHQLPENKGPRALSHFVFV